VNDAYTIPCANAREQKSITERMSEDFGALSVTVD